MQCMYQKCMFSPLLKMCIFIKRYDKIQRLVSYSKYSLPRWSTKKKYVTLSLDEKTLTGRLWYYINHNNKTLVEKYIAHDPVDTNTEIMMWRKLWTMYDNMQHHSINKQLQMLNIECCIYLDTMSTPMNLICLSWFMKLAPNKILQMSFYRQSIEKLVTDIEFLTEKELIQLMFYVSLQKKDIQVQQTLRKCMRLLNDKTISEISIEELCIICNSTFKSSTKITNIKILDKVNDVLGENLHLLNDAAVFITLVKSIRHNSFQNEDMLNTISCAILFNKTHGLYSFAAICHILALYASYLYYDEHILDVFSNRCLELLDNYKEVPRHVHVSENIRIKDVHRFLWACSTLGYNLKEESFIKIIMPKIMLEMNIVDNRDIHYIFDIIFYMWVLNYKAVDILPDWVTEENISCIKDPKCKQRLNLLLTCIQLEDLKLYKSLNVKQNPSSASELKSKQQISHRPQLHRVYNCLNEILPKLEVDKFEIGYQIPHLDIVGITGYKKNIYKSIFIEVLDDYVCVKNKSSQHTGLMQMKLRLLDKMEESLVTIHSEDISMLTDCELKEYLESELNNVSL